MGPKESATKTTKLHYAKLVRRERERERKRGGESARPAHQEAWLSSDTVWSEIPDCQQHRVFYRKREIGLPGI